MSHDTWPRGTDLGRSTTTVKSPSGKEEAPYLRLIRAWISYDPSLIEKYNNDASFNLLLKNLAKLAVAVLLEGRGTYFNGWIDRDREQKPMTVHEICEHEWQAMFNGAWVSVGSSEEHRIWICPKPGCLVKRLEYRDGTWSGDE